MNRNGINSAQTKQTLYVNNGNPNGTSDKKMNFGILKSLKNPLCFNCDGIKVRVSFEGTADLNELVKDLFLAG